MTNIHTHDSGMIAVIDCFHTNIQVVCGYPYYKAALKGLRHCSVGMDLLVVMATSIAYIYSVVVLVIETFMTELDYKTFFDSIALLLLFISFGRLLEHIAKVGHCRLCSLE